MGNMVSSQQDLGATGKAPAAASEGGEGVRHAHTCTRARQAQAWRGGRSGPSAAKMPTEGWSAANTVGAAAPSGTVSTGLGNAPTEQQAAQALQVCALAWADSASMGVPPAASASAWP